jgi:hypothetical protein
MDDSIRVLISSFLEISLYLLWVEDLENICLWLEVIIKFIQKFDVVLDGL